MEVMNEKDKKDTNHLNAHMQSHQNQDRYNQTNAFSNFNRTTNMKSDNIIMLINR